MTKCSKIAQPVLSRRMSKLSSVMGPARTSAMFKRLKISPIKALYKYYTPNNINLAGGIPLEATFPFKNMTIGLDDGSSYSVEKGGDFHLNYHMSEGIKPLKEWALQHINTVHSPPFQHNLSLTVGATDSWYNIVNMFNSDCILFDEYVYGASITPCTTVGKQAIGVKSDEFGIIPDELRQTVLLARSKGFVVDILYTIPVGHNPLGLTIPLERKKELYKVCQELDLIIVEDDAYYYLYYPSEELPGVRNLPKSFLSLDTDGRVIRIDTVSKILSPGMRVGWVTGPEDFIAKYVLLQSQTVNFPSSFAQSAMLGLVKHWGEEGLHTHLQNLQRHYKVQRDVFVNAVQKYFKPDQVKYTTPTGGMFFWITFPGLKKTSTHDLFVAFAAADVIVVPGTGFQVAGIHELLEQGVVPVTLEQRAAGLTGYTAAAALAGEAVSGDGSVPAPKESPSPCIRACYAAVDSAKITSAVKTMAEVVTAMELKERESA